MYFYPAKVTHQTRKQETMLYWHLILLFPGIAFIYTFQIPLELSVAKMASSCQWNMSGSDMHRFQAPGKCVPSVLTLSLSTHWVLGAWRPQGIAGPQDGQSLSPWIAVHLPTESTHLGLLNNKWISIALEPLYILESTYSYSLAYPNTPLSLKKYCGQRLKLAAF